MDVWVVVTLVSLLMVVGSVLWIMPSKRDRKIAKLRQQAIIAGIKVRIMKYPMINLSGRVEENCYDGATYSFVDAPLKGVKSGWMLIRNYDQSDSLANQDESLSPIENWGWYINQNSLSDEIIEHLALLAGQYQEQLFAISVMADSVSIGWNEQGSSEDLDHFRQWATELVDLFGQTKESDDQADK